MKRGKGRRRRGRRKEANLVVGLLGGGLAPSYFVQKLRQIHERERRGEFKQTSRGGPMIFL